jgi:hypothetical protein
VKLDIRFNRGALIESVLESVLRKVLGLRERERERERKEVTAGLQVACTEDLRRNNS